MILAVDTTTNILSVAAVDGGNVLGEYNLNFKKDHAKKLMMMIEHLLSNLNLKAEDFDSFAAASGPGSFTGVRIGMTTVCTLAQAMGKKVAPVDTLFGMAYNARNLKTTVLAAMKARENLVYAGIYKFDEQACKRVLEPQLISIEELNKFVSAYDGHIYAVGTTDGIEGVTTLFDGADVHRASAVGLAAEFDGKFTDYKDADIVYLNKSRAERDTDEGSWKKWTK